MAREKAAEFSVSKAAPALHADLRELILPDFKIVQTLSAQLGWSHFGLLFGVNDPLAREFYSETHDAQLRPHGSVEK